MAKGNSVKIRIDGDASDLEKKLKNIGNTAKAGLADVKAGIDLATQAFGKLADVAQKGVNYNATIEQLKTSFEVMTGSAEKAVDVVERLRVMGAETPFEMKDLASTTQLLMQYGFTADEALDRMKMLGDVAQGNVQAMNSIALGYAQMSSAQKVNLVDIKQMINGGFNPLQEISERTGESMGSLYDRISKGKITVDEITESMRHATSEGGRFFQSMEKQSQTLNGQLSTLKDNADQLLGSLTEGVSEGLRDQILPFANNLVGELQTAFETGGYQGLVDTATDMIPDLLGLMTGELQDGIAGLTRWLPQGATKLMQALPAALRAGTAVVPQITQALFEVASVVITDLVAMLPALAPVLLEGFADMLKTAVNGVYDMIAGVFTGIEQAFHQGQTKIAGVWVDTEATAKYTFDINTDIDPAKQAIEEAYRNIQEALSTDLLSDDQREEIEGMIGADYDSIKSKLMSFGISDEEAGKLASTITDAGTTLMAQIEKLDLSVDSATVAKWMFQANGSRLKLRLSMEKAGLTTSDQNKVIGVFNKMTDNITGSLPNVIDEVYTTLTDGTIENDDKKTLTQRLDEALGDDLAEVDLWLKSKIGELDTTSATYQQDVASLTEEAATYKAEMETLHAQMVALVESLAGQPTAVVEARMAEFAKIEARIAEINTYIDETTAKARSAEQAAFNVVRSGAKADESTISTAISFKVSEFRLDEQSAEDAYKTAVAELNRQLDAGEITKAQYDARAHTEETKLAAAKQAALNAYENAIGQIFAGIAESEGISEAVRQAGEQIDIAQMLTGAAEKLSMMNEFDSLVGNQLGEQLTQKIADAISIDPETIRNMRVEDAMGTLGDYAQELFSSAQETIEQTDSSKLQEVYAAALEEGILEGTSFDTESAKGQIAALFTSVFNSAATTATPEVIASGEALGLASTSEMSDYDGALAAGEDTVDGLSTALARAEQIALRHGRAAGTAFAQGYKETQEIQSPSKVMMRMGRYTGEGLEIGLRESMARAVAVAKQLTGQIATAADISGMVRVANMPNIGQEVAVANAQQPPTPVMLNGVQIAEIQGYNNSVQLAWQNTRAAKGVGSR